MPRTSKKVRADSSASSPRGGADFLSPESELLVYERELRSGGEFCFIAGIDEAGRGCCAGPVVAAAVVFTDPDRVPSGVFDSKQLTEKRREELRALLVSDPSVRYAVAEVSPEEIDELDILRATWKAMRLALEGVIPPAQFALVDGNPVQGLPLPSRSIVQGDARCASIAAASILAKTHRDHLMVRAAEQYPEYGFEIHKGYCTKLHTERLRRFGPCPLHRKTFEPVASLLNPLEQGTLF